MDTVNYAPIPDFNTDCSGFSNSLIQTDLSICDSTSGGYPGFCFITSDVDSVWGNTALQGKDYTWGGGTKFMAGKVFKDSLAQIWMADSLSFSAADTVSFGAMIATISPQLENAFQLILEIREVGGNLVFSDTVFLFQGNDLWMPIYKNWICSQTGMYAFSFSVLAGNQADALFALDDVGIRIVKNQNDVFPIIQHATYTQHDSTLHFKIANASAFTTLIWENSISGIVSIGVLDTLDMPAVSGMQYSISGQKAIGCRVKNGPVLWSHADQDSISWNSNRVTPDTVGIIPQHVWTMEHCGLQYTISSVSCQTITLPGPVYTAMNNCAPQNSSPTVDIIINGMPNPGCYLIDKGVLYWYQVGSLPNNTYLDTLFPSIPITVLNNTTNQQQQFTGVLRGQEPTGMLFGPFINSWLTSWSVDITPIISGNATYTISGLPQGSIFSGETLGASILVAYTNLLSNSMGYLGVNEALFVRSYLTSVQMRLNNLCQIPVSADAFTIAALDAGNNTNVTVANQPIPTGGNHCYNLYTSNPTNIPPGNNPFTFSSYYNGPSGMYWQSPCTHCDILPTNVLALNDGPVCVGGTLNLSLSFTDNSGNIPLGPLNFTFFWQGLNGYNSNLQNPQISPMTVAGYGLYSAYIVIPGIGNNCVLGPFTTNVLSPNHVNLGSSLFTCIPVNQIPPPPVNVTIGNSVPPNLTYLWSTGATTQTIQIDGYVAGCYWVQIIDTVTNCISVSNTICNTPTPNPEVLVTSSYDCNTNCYTLTGTIPSPSQGPYTFNWSYTDIMQQTQLVTNVLPGTIDILGPSILCYGSINGLYPYTLSVTDNYGCSSAVSAIDTIQHVDWNSMNSPDLYICPSAQIGDPLFTTLQSMGFSFIWTAPNGSTFSTAPNPIVNSTNMGPGTYMVTFTHPDGCTGFDEFVVSTCCHFSNGEYALFDQDVVGGNTFPPGSEVVVQGTIFIENQVTWQNMKVWMQPGAKIVITPSTTVPPISPNRLILDNTTIKSDCNDQLWDCIEVQSDPVVTGLIQNGLLVTNNSLIEDAKAAIYSKDGGFFAILSSRLNRNWVHVRVDDFTRLNQSNSVEYHPGLINNSILSCSSELIPSGSGQRSLAGVYIQNSSSGNGRVFSINGPLSPNYSTGVVTSSLAMNLFQNMHYGVYAENTDLYVQRTDFRNIFCDNNYPTPACQQPGNGDFPTAIITRANGALLEVKDCQFRNTRNGIAAIASANVNIRSNIFNNMMMIPLTLATDRNIWIRKSPQFSTVNILSNTMNHGRVGVFLDNNLLSTIITAGNTIDHCQIGINSMGNASSDIRLGLNHIKSVPVYTPNLQFTHQAINAVENATNRYLIFRNTLEAKDQGVMMTGGAGKFQVWANTIQMQYNHNLLPNQGIWSVGMVKPQFSKNIINGPGFYVPSSTINNLTGIRFTRNVNPRLYCNETYLTRDNMTAEGNNLPSEVRRNKFTWSRVGILFLNNGRTGPQLNPNHTTDNEFHCPFYASSMRGENSPFASMDIFYYSSGLPQFDPSYTTGCTPATIAFSANPPPLPSAIPMLNPTISDYSIALDFCNTPGVFQRTSSEEEYEEEPIEYPEAEVSESLVEYLHQALDSLESDSLEINKHYLKKNLYTWLHKQDSLVQADSILAAFYDRESGGPFALMESIQQAISNADYGYARELAENWPTGNAIVVAYKKLLEIQLDLLEARNEEPIAQSQIEKLQLLAEDCQTEAGNAVVTARAMLLTLGIEPQIPECDLELLDSLETDSIPQTPEQETILIVYPNPADTEVTFEHDAAGTEGYHIVVTNTMGNILHTAEFPVSDREITWNTTPVIQGAYYVLLYHEEVLVDYKLLSIIH